MIYVAAFSLVFIGFCFGFIVAVLCAASGRASRMEEGIEDKLWKIPRPYPWPDPHDPDEQWKSARDAYGGKAEHEI